MTDQDEAPTRQHPVPEYDYSWLGIPIPAWVVEWREDLREVPWRAALTLLWFGYFAGVVTIAVAVAVGFFFALR